MLFKRPSSRVESYVLMVKLDTVCILSDEIASRDAQGFKTTF